MTDEIEVSEQINAAGCKILLKAQREKYIPDIELLSKIKRYAFDNITCTAGIYCKNLERIRDLINDHTK